MGFLAANMEDWLDGIDVWWVLAGIIMPIRYSPVSMYTVTISPTSSSGVDGAGEGGGDCSGEV